ncbi:MAG: polyprenyl synthetase family protein [Bacteroidales bacterium]|nr:polyprenyl synthetase family protein [Bacteroidales bacterium]
MTSENTINAAVKSLFEGIEFKAQPEGLYDPLRYMIAIGGKRVRPKLCLTAYSIFKDSLDDAILSAAAGLEVFHTFTLIHDDIMDKSPLRRAMPTVWKKWNPDTAILSGDVMLIDNYNRMARVPGPARDSVMDLFSTTAAEVCEGQQLDMEFEFRDEIGMDEYLRMIGLKTAVLLACAAKTGALVAGASEKECDALYDYGYQLGMAFQIADDYLDAYGDEKVFGKPIGGDIINEKKSWLTVRAFEKCTDKARLLQEMKAVPSNKQEEQEKINAVKALYDAAGVPSEALEAIERYTGAALSCVDGLGLGGVKVQALKRFADKLIGRAK